MTRRFYAGLGFQHRPIGFGADRYAILTRLAIELHFYLLPDLVPEASMFSCYVRVFDADALYREFQARGLPREGFPHLGVIEDRQWGMREFHLLDPDANLLRIGSIIGKAEHPEPTDSFLLAALRKT